MNGQAEPQRACGKCGHIHPPMIDCLEATLAGVKKMMLRIGTIDRCDCGVGTIYWVTHITGAKAPYTEQGLLHFLNCTGRFRKKK